MPRYKEGDRVLVRRGNDFVPATIDEIRRDGPYPYRLLVDDEDPHYHWNRGRDEIRPLRSRSERFDEWAMTDWGAFTVIVGVIAGGPLLGWVIVSLIDWLVY